MNQWREIIEGYRRAEKTIEDGKKKWLSQLSFKQSSRIFEALYEVHVRTDRVLSRGSPIDTADRIPDLIEFRKKFEKISLRLQT